MQYQGAKLKLRIPTILSMLVLAGCVTAPVKTDFENSRVYNEDYEKVWGQAVQFFATNNIPIKTIAKDSGVIYAERLSFDAADADCGSHPLEMPLNTSVSFNVFVQKQDVQTKVSVNASYHEGLGDMYGRLIENVSCESHGTIEKTILDAIH